MFVFRAGASCLALAAIVGLLFLSTGCNADLPDPRSTDIVLLEVSSFGGFVAFGEPRHITDRSGYDNQPAFTADGNGVLFSSQHGLQADVYLYNIETDDLDRMTLTLESEYSPRPLPEGPGFSCVRVEQDGRQRLWSFDPAADEAPRLLLPAPDYVGYYAWADEGTVALHVLGRTATLQLADPPAAPRVVHEAIGRSVQAVPGRPAISFAADDEDGNAWIHVHDLLSGASRRLAPALVGSLDHAWLPDGTLLMARDAIVYALRPAEADGVEDEQDEDQDRLWEPWADLGDQGIEGISRIAVSPLGDRLALVVRH